MFEKLVESNGTQPFSPLRKRLLTVCSAAVLSFAGVAVLTSMFSETLAMGSEGWEAERLFYPAMKTEPEMAPRPENRSTPATDPNRAAVAVRREHIARLDEPVNKVPDRISAVPSALKARPIGSYTIGDKDFDPPNIGITRGSDGEATGFTEGSDNEVDTRKKPSETVSLAPPPKLRPSEEKPGYIGIVNGRALDLVIPVYPQSARQLGIRGHVKVQVLIDENGNVKSAFFVEGLGMLRLAAIDAAKASRFTPTKLNGKNVPVRGLIIYNFK